MRSHSLRYAIPLLLFGCGGAVAAVDLAFGLQRSDRRVEEQARARALFLCETIAGEAESAIRQGELRRVRASLIRAQADRHLRAAVLFDPEDRVRWASVLTLVGRPVGETGFAEARGAFQQARAAFAAQSLVSADGSRLWTLHPVPLRARRGELIPDEVGVLAMAHDLTGVKAAARADSMREDLQHLVPLAALCALLGVVFHVTFTRPTQLLVAATERIARGEPPAPLPPGSAAELQSVSLALAAMATQLETRTAEVRELAETRRQIFDLVPHMIFARDEQGRFVLANEATAAAYGTTAEALIGRAVGDVQPDADHARRALDDDRRVLGTGRSHEVAEEPFRDASGAERFLQTARVPLELAWGTRAVLGVSIDVTDRKRFEERQRLMVAELDHRVKNALAMIVSLAEQTLASSRDLDDFGATFTGRVRSLARAHEALAATAWAGVDLADVVRLAVIGPHPDRLRLLGTTPVRLPPAAAAPVGLALHELTTNAAKYGAFSVPDGRVEVDWSLDPGEDLVSLEWREQGGPAVAGPPASPGLGLALVRGLIEHELGGSVELGYPREGVRCRLRVPCAARTEVAA